MCCNAVHPLLLNNYLSIYKTIETSTNQYITKQPASYKFIITKVAKKPNNCCTQLGEVAINYYLFHNIPCYITQLIANYFRIQWNPAVITAVTVITNQFAGKQYWNYAISNEVHLCWYYVSLCGRPATYNN